MYLSKGNVWTLKIYCVKNVTNDEIYENKGGVKYMSKKIRTEAVDYLFSAILSLGE